MSPERRARCEAGAVVRRADASDWERVRDVRLRALATDLHAFLETVEDARTLPDVHWRERATPSETQATFVEERVASFAAMVAVFVADDPVTTYLVGMWVASCERPASRSSSSSTCSTGRATIGACESCSPWSRGTTVQRGCTRSAASSRSRNRRSSRTSPTQTTASTHSSYDPRTLARTAKGRACGVIPNGAP
jgi:hypothetical protein